MKNRFWNRLLKCFLIKKISIWKSENERRKRVFGSLLGCWRNFGLRRTWVFFYNRRKLRGWVLVHGVRVLLRKMNFGPIWLCFLRTTFLTFRSDKSGNISHLSFYCISLSNHWKASCKLGCKTKHIQSKSSFPVFIILCTPGFMSCRLKFEPHFEFCKSARSKWSIFQVLVRIKLRFLLKGFWFVSKKSRLNLPVR